MVLMTSSITHLMTSKESMISFFPAQQVEIGGGRAGGGKSEEEVGESGEGRGEDEEVKGTNKVEGGGGRGGGGGWSGGDGPSFGMKPREFPWLLIHLTRQTLGEDKGGRLGEVT